MNAKGIPVKTMPNLICDDNTTKRFTEAVMPVPGCGCWIWIGPQRTNNGYGYMRAYSKGGKGLKFTNISAHRLSWLLHVGDIPVGLCVLHHCDTPLCVNPQHLFLGTHKDNTKDRDSKGRQICRRGSSCNWAKLTEETVFEIRRLYAQGGINQSQLARQFNVTQRAIWGIVRLKTWRHLHA